MEVLLDLYSCRLSTVIFLFSRAFTVLYIAIHLHITHLNNNMSGLAGMIYNFNSNTKNPVILDTIEILTHSF